MFFSITFSFFFQENFLPIEELLEQCLPAALESESMLTHAELIDWTFLMEKNFENIFHNKTCF